MKYTVYETATGKVCRAIECPIDMVEQQLAPGESFVEAGDSDWRCCQVDLITKEVVHFVPTSPSADVEWEPNRKEFVLSQIGQRRQDNNLRIQTLERAQARVVREFLIDPDKVGDDGKTPRQRLQEIEDEVADKRRT